MIPTVEMHQLHPSLDPNTTGYILVQQAETVSLPVTHHHHQGAIKSENNDPDSIDEFLRATNIEDFLWYNCPKCDFRVSNSKGSPVEERLYKKTSQYSKFEFSLPKTES